MACIYCASCSAFLGTTYQCIQCTVYSAQSKGCALWYMQDGESSCNLEWGEKEGLTSGLGSGSEREIDVDITNTNAITVAFSNWGPVKLRWAGLELWSK